MNKSVVVLPGLDAEVRFSVPERRLMEVLSPASVSPHGDLATLARRALAEPIGCSPLSEIVRSEHKVLIAVDDITRTTPTREIIPMLLEHLRAIGCRDDSISFAMALGTHRPMTADELEFKLGRDVARAFRVINTPARDRDCFVDTGKSWGGVPIEVHRAVVEADVVIGLGSVIPHGDAGWSGGAKIILPGLCSERTITENHLFAATFPGNLLGRETTPIRENMEGVVATIGLDYILNVVMTPANEIIDVMGGHFVAAQRAAARVAAEIYTVPSAGRVDVVIANSYPKEVDLWQASTGIWAGELIVKPGGVVILHAHCREGVGAHHPEFLRCMGMPAQELSEAIRDGRVADKVMGAEALQVARMLEHMRLVFVTGGLDAVEVRAAGFPYYVSLQDAVDEQLLQAGPEARVSVLTHGGYTYPVQR